jgi:hypothetical protein
VRQHQRVLRCRLPEELRQVQLSKAARTRPALRGRLWW